MGNEILQRQRVVRQRKERGIRVAERTVGGYVGIGVATSVLAVVCKQMQQPPAMLGPAVHHGKGTVRVKGRQSLWNGMWHRLRYEIIMRNVIHAE